MNNKKNIHTQHRIHRYMWKSSSVFFIRNEIYMWKDPWFVKQTNKKIQKKGHKSGSDPGRSGAASGLRLEIRHRSGGGVDLPPARSSPRRPAADWWSSSSRLPAGSSGSEYVGVGGGRRAARASGWVGVDWWGARVSPQKSLLESGFGAHLGTYTTPFKFLFKTY
jgi:hypothetical protein